MAKKQKVPNGLYHEALDRAYTLQAMSEVLLSDHPAITSHKKLSKKLVKAQMLLGDIYNSIGNKMDWED